MRLWTLQECYIAGTNSLKEELLEKSELSIYIVDKNIYNDPMNLKLFGRENFAQIGRNVI